MNPASSWVLKPIGRVHKVTPGGRVRIKAGGGSELLSPRTSGVFASPTADSDDFKDPDHDLRTLPELPSRFLTPGRLLFLRGRKGLRLVDAKSGKLLALMTKKSSTELPVFLSKNVVEWVKSDAVASCAWVQIPLVEEEL